MNCKFRSHLDMLLFQLPWNASTFVHQMPRPTLFVCLKFAIPYVLVHAKEILGCCHSLDRSHMVCSVTIFCGRRHSIYLDFGWCIPSAEFSVQTHLVLVFNRSTFLKSGFKWALFVEINEKHQPISFPLSPGPIELHRVAKLTLKDVRDEGCANGVRQTWMCVLWIHRQFGLKSTIRD